MDALDVIRYFDDGCHSPASLAFLSPQRKPSSVLGMGVQFLTKERRAHDQHNAVFVDFVPSWLMQHADASRLISHIGQTS
jgi:hypothetical protein